MFICGGPLVSLLKLYTGSRTRIAATVALRPTEVGRVTASLS
jgi:hypothetical protein